MTIQKYIEKHYVLLSVFESGIEPLPESASSPLRASSLSCKNISKKNRGIFEYARIVLKIVTTWKTTQTIEAKFLWKFM